MFGLETFNLNERIFIDVETISWDDKREAFRPYHGDRMSTVIVGQHGKQTLAFPIRNRNKSDRLLPLDKFLSEYREFVREIKIYANLNLKFDMRNMAVDHCYFLHPELMLEDTGVLARLINNDQQSFSLEDLCIQYKCQLKKKDLLEPYLLSTKDYGAVPVDILCEYGIGDVDSAMELHHKLLNQLPMESAKVWYNECKFANELFKVEDAGIPIDSKFLKKRRIRLIQEMIKLVEDIKVVTKEKINNPGSTAQVAAYFIGEGVDPVLYNEPTDKMKAEGRVQGNASWNADALEQINHPVATLLIDYKEKQIQESTFCAGWMNELDENDRIHPDFKSNGTKTGRPSSSKPNVYNPPKWIMEAITIPDGYIGVKWDKSQIEYRIFAHYAEDPELLKAYADNPKIDYHQILADRLGIPRDPTKKINFGMLYGMGQAKTKRSVAAQFGEMDRSEKTKPEDKLKIRAALRRYVGMSGKDPFGKVVSMIGDTGPIPTTAFDLACEAILSEYHARVPSVKSMQKRIKTVIGSRGFIRNFFGRRYFYPPNLAYVALNALIQGSAADFFKDRLVTLFSKADKRVKMVDMIYDSCFSIMPIEIAQDYWELCKQVVCESPFKVPVLIDGEVALYNWGNITKIQNNNVLETAALICKAKS
jgi:DNA polymerase I-like protein with 3'-5' exonuclease and polymerase domains